MPGPELGTGDREMSVIGSGMLSMVRSGVGDFGNLYNAEKAHF